MYLCLLQISEIFKLLRSCNEFYDLVHCLKLAKSIEDTL